MISIEEQQKLMLAIAKKLNSRINIYAIGGTAMMFLGLKDTTLDIDLVFENEKDREIFINLYRIALDIARKIFFQQVQLVIDNSIG